MTKIKSIINPVKMREDVSFSDNDLDTAWMDQSSKAASYGVMHAKAEHQESAAKNNLAIVGASIANELREYYSSEGIKVSESRLEAEVIIDSRYQSAFKDWNDSKLISGLGRAANEALRQRRDMIVQASKKALDEKSYKAALSQKPTS